ncbi:MAG: nuclear transport factor 2 family protein [Chloroflexota bacterium]
MSSAKRASRYEIRVQGALDPRWSAWFDGLEVCPRALGETALTGPIRDQAELYGVLAKVRDLGLSLVEVRRLDRDVPRDMQPGPDRTQFDAGQFPRERTAYMSHDQIRDLVRHWAEAESQCNADALDGLMTDDCTLVGPRGFVLDRQQCLQRYRTGDLKMEAFAWSDMNVREYGQTAVVQGVVTQKAAYQGHDASGRFRATQIAVQQSGSWKCAALQFSGPIPEMPPRPR